MNSNAPLNVSLPLVVAETTVNCSTALEHGLRLQCDSLTSKTLLAGNTRLNVCGAVSAGAPHGALAQGSGAPHQENQAEM